jgi:hypothetical protein
VGSVGAGALTHDPEKCVRFSDKIMRKIMTHDPEKCVRFSDKIMRKIMTHDPEKCARFSDKIMRKIKDVGRRPFRWKRIVLAHDPEKSFVKNDGAQAALR